MTTKTERFPKLFQEIIETDRLLNICKAEAVVCLEKLKALKARREMLRQSAKARYGTGGASK